MHRDRALFSVPCDVTCGWGLEEWDRRAQALHTETGGGAVAGWLRAPWHCPRCGFVKITGFSVVRLYGDWLGSRMRGTRGELLNCLGALSSVIPCLSCPLFVYEQGITSTVCVQIC